MNFKIEVNINKKDLVISQFMIELKSLFTHVFYILLSLILSYYETFIKGHTEYRIFVFIVLAILLYLFMNLFHIIIILVKCILNITKTKKCCCEYVFEDNIMIKTSKNIKSEYSYNVLTKVLTFMNRMYIGISHHQYLVAPKRCFRNEADFNKLYDFLKIKIKENNENN